MKIVGLTGNIGSGKSTVALIFKALNVPVFNADTESKKILDEHDVIRLISGRFGNELLTSEKRIDRKQLASRVFACKDSLNWLNSIMHPRVIEHFRQWALIQNAPYVLQEAAIIYESGIADEFDCIIHVSCPLEIAVNRVMKRDSADSNSVLQRMQFQIPDEKKSAMADFVIVNEGNSLIIPQVLTIHGKLLKVCP